MAQIIDGKSIAEKKLLKLKEDIKEQGVFPSLAVFQVGDNPVSSTYIEMKKKKLKEIGMSVNVYKLKENVREEEIEEKVASVKEDGVIVQLPLLKGINKENVLNAIPENKDVDLLSGHSLGKFYKGSSKNLPPVVCAVKILLEESNGSIEGKTATVVGFGDLVGKPVSIFLAREKATVSIVNRHTKDLSLFTKNADILVSGAGVPDLIKGDMVKNKGIFIDAGTSVSSGKLKGDIEKESMKKTDGLFACVPGGVGPLTVYCLARNLFNLKTNEY